MFVAPGDELTIGTAIGVISALGILIMVFRYWLKSARMIDCIMDEVIRFEKNKLVQKNHRWEDR
jgi:hypothetical protein